MALDSRAKRASAIGIPGPVAGIGVESDAAQPQAWRQAAGHGYYGILAVIIIPAPDDDDGDTVITTRFDLDGYVVRPPRTTLLLAVESLRNDSLGGYDRMDMDQFEGRSQQQGRNDSEEGHNLRLLFWANRAGDALAIDYLEIEFAVLDSSQQPLVPDLPTGFDLDGYYLQVPETRFRHALDSLLNVDLLDSSVDRDGNLTIHDLDSDLQRGQALRLQHAGEGRAGAPSGLYEVEIEYSIETDQTVREAKV